MRKAIVIILLLFLADPALAQDRIDLTGVFHPEKTATEKAADVMYWVALVGMAADWRTTREFGKYYDTPHPDTGKIYWENGLYGRFTKYPTPRQVNLFFIAEATALTYIQYYTPWGEYKLWGYSFVALSHLYAVKHNIASGIELRF